MKFLKLQKLRYLLLVSAGFLSLNIAEAQTDPEGQVLNYRDANIRAFIEDIAALTGRTFIVDPRVTGKINVVSSKPVSQEGAFQTFLSALRVNGFTVVPTASGAYKIVPAEVASTDAGPVNKKLIGDRLVTQVFVLKFADPLAVQAATKPFIFKNGRIFARKGMPLVIVTDYAENLERIAQLVATMDIDRSVIRTLVLENTSATEMSEIALSLSSQPGFEDGAQSRLTVMPLESSNTLILRGQKATIDTLLPVIRELDKNNAARGSLKVMYLKHADAEKILPILETITKSLSRRNANGQTAASGDEITVGAYAEANALVINAPAETQKEIISLINMLDVPRAQVLVEAIIVEVSEGAARDIGVQYVLAGGKGSTIPFTVSNYSNTAPNILAATGALLLNGGSNSTPTDETNSLRTTAVNSLLGFNGFGLGIAGRASNGTVFGAILTALQKDTGSNILSTPSIVTLDNEPAHFLSGQEIPITTGESLGSNNTNPFRTVERKNVGILLEVTPQINEGDEIRLAIRQEISSVAGPISTNSNDLITNKREVKTTVRIKDGEILVLGGLIQQTETLELTKVPFLGDIPLLGRLFRSEKKSSAKTNLMIFLRPTILRDSTEAKAATARKYEYIRARQAGVKSQIPLDVLIQEVMGGEVPSLSPVNTETNNDTQQK